MMHAVQAVDVAHAKNNDESYEYNHEHLCELCEL